MLLRRTLYCSCIDVQLASNSARSVTRRARILPFYGPPRRQVKLVAPRRSPCCAVGPRALSSALVQKVAGGPDAARDGAHAHHHRRRPFAHLLPWIVTAAIFAAIFSRVPVRKVWEALAGARLLPYLAIMVPYSVAYLAIDTFCLTRVLNWFNTRVAYRDVLPIRASTYLLTLINSHLGQGAIAVYLNRRDGVPLLEVARSVLFLMFVELYQLAFFSTL